MDGEGVGHVDRGASGERKGRVDWGGPVAREGGPRGDRTHLIAALRPRCQSEAGWVPAPAEPSRPPPLRGTQTSGPGRIPDPQSPEWKVMDTGALCTAVGVGALPAAILLSLTLIGDSAAVINRLEP